LRCRLSHSLTHTAAAAPPLRAQIKSKTTNEVVDFYYTWKKSAHYQMWKDLGKPHARFGEKKEQQWTALQEKMSGF
jgi:hypothetical protein